MKNIILIFMSTLFAGCLGAQEDLSQYTAEQNNQLNALGMGKDTALYFRGGGARRGGGHHGGGYYGGHRGYYGGGRVYGSGYGYGGYAPEIIDEGAQEQQYE